MKCSFHCQGLCTSCSVCVFHCVCCEMFCMPMLGDCTCMNFENEIQKEAIVESELGVLCKNRLSSDDLVHCSLYFQFGMLAMLFHTTRSLNPTRNLECVVLKAYNFDIRRDLSYTVCPCNPYIFLASFPGPCCFQCCFNCHTHKCWNVQTSWWYNMWNFPSFFIQNFLGHLESTYKVYNNWCSWSVCVCLWSGEETDFFKQWK